MLDGIVTGFEISHVKTHTQHSVLAEDPVINLPWSYAGKAIPFQIREILFSVVYNQLHIK